MKERVELNSSVQNIPLFIAVSLPKVYQKHNHQYLEKSTLSRGNWSSVLFYLQNFPFKTAQDVVDVVDNVMKMKKKDLQESQRTSKSSSK